MSGAGRFAGWIGALWLSAGCVAGCGGGGAASEAPPPQVKTITAQDLAKLPDDQLEEAVLDIVEALIGNLPDPDSQRLAALPEGARAVFSTTHLEGEVGNGGFNQYFWNTDGRIVQDALQGYKLMGMPKHAASVRKAIALWKGEQTSRDKPQSKDSLQAFSESYNETKLNALDEPFFDLDKTEDPELLRRAFIRKSPEKCVPAGGPSSGRG
jgi:hypothetical protein